MSSGSFKQIEIKCPFYKYDDGKGRIACEGIVADSTLALIFHRRDDYQLHLDVFCCRHYEKCEVYRTLMTKYEED